jgi:hypothetical protein
VTPTDVALVISGGGLLLSVICTAVGVGIAWGLTRGDLRSLQTALTNSASSVEVQNLASRLGRIEGLFEYRLRQEGQGKHVQ